MFDRSVRFRLAALVLVSVVVLVADPAHASHPICVGTKLGKTAGAVGKAFKVCTTGMTSPCAIPVYQKLSIKLDKLTAKHGCANARSTGVRQ